MVPSIKVALVSEMFENANLSEYPAETILTKYLELPSINESDYNDYGNL